MPINKIQNTRRFGTAKRQEQDLDCNEGFFSSLNIWSFLLGLSKYTKFKALRQAQGERLYSLSSSTSPEVECILQLNPKTLICIPTQNMGTKATCRVGETHAVKIGS